MKTVLVAINAKYIHSNLAVHSLRAYANEYGSGQVGEIEVAEYTINQHTDEILMDLYQKNADLLCFSCYIWNLDYVETLVRDLHKVMPTVPIWVGGPEVSYDAEATLKRLPELTGVMFGEGEETFLELVQYYYSICERILEIREEFSEATTLGLGEATHCRKRLGDILGIAYRNADKTIIINGPRPTIDLSRVPFVYGDMDSFKHKIIYYESSRGCPFSCSYCLSSVDKCLRFRDLELVKKELQIFIDAEVPQVKFVDRTFNCNHKHAMEIWKYLLDHDQGKTNFHFEVAADLLSEEELTLIGQMRPGLIQLEIGVQSTNEETIWEIHRTMKFSQVEAVVKRIKEGKNIHQHLDLIAGLPFEDLESFKKSFNDVYRLKPEQLQLGFLKVLKGSYMEENKEAYGLIYKARPPYEVLSTKWISYEDVLELKLVEDMVETYYNSGQFTNTLTELEKEFDSPYEMYLSLGQYYERNGLRNVSHSRIAGYEILYAFMQEVCVSKEVLMRELLTFDLLLRENVKTRPTFAGEYTLNGEELKDLYEKIGRKELRKMTHIERFHYDVMDTREKGEYCVFFDYQKRNPLTNDATVYIF